MATYDATPEDDGLPGLFETSPEREAHTSAAAEVAMLLGLVALLAAPFAIMRTLAVGAATLGVLAALVGLATTSRPDVAGRALVPVGLGLAVTALLLVALRYLGVDTTFGDALLPQIGDWLERLNARFPAP